MEQNNSICNYYEPDLSNDIVNSEILKDKNVANKFYSLGFTALALIPLFASSNDTDSLEPFKINCINSENTITELIISSSDRTFERLIYIDDDIFIKPGEFLKDVKIQENLKDPIKRKEYLGKLSRKFIEKNIGIEDFIHSERHKY
jgi:hypothetical protein